MSEPVFTLKLTAKAMALLFNDNQQKRHAFVDEIFDGLQDSLDNDQYQLIQSFEHQPDNCDALKRIPSETTMLKFSSSYTLVPRRFLQGIEPPAPEPELDNEVQYLGTWAEVLQGPAAAVIDPIVQQLVSTPPQALPDSPVPPPRRRLRRKVGRMSANGGAAAAASTAQPAGSDEVMVVDKPRPVGNNHFGPASLIRFIPSNVADFAEYMCLSVDLDNPSIIPWTMFQDRDPATLAKYEVNDDICLLPDCGHFCTLETSQLFVRDGVPCCAQCRREIKQVVKLCGPNFKHALAHLNDQ